MPRELKTIPKAAPAAKKPKKKNGYFMPESIPLGEVLKDLSKNEWKIGPSIGVGGFGEIYTACDAKKVTKKVDDYESVVKIEPHGNGPLFVEMHFYMRNAKLDDIKKFMQEHSLKSLGMPYLLGSGSHELNGKKHRFIVMPRYGKDIWSIFLTNNKKLPDHTIYRLAIQMLDVYEYIHGCTYVHGDLKGANMLLGYGKSGNAQTYLVDFGLASHYTSKDFKPDPKKMHNGTIEYTSRDAHSGVPTMRGDFEILGYNLLQWTCSILPWETENLLSNPGKVQKSKEEFMTNLESSIKKYYKNSVPVPIHSYLKYVTTLKYNDEPDYKKCREIFQTALKSMSKTNTGDLDFKMVSPVKKSENKSTKVNSPRKTVKNKNETWNDTVDSDDDVVLPSPKKDRHISRSPAKRNRSAYEDNEKQTRSRVLKISPKAGVAKKSPHNIQISPKVRIKKNMGISTPVQKPGKTIINDNITPSSSCRKTYEFNFELDVSMDANVILNVKRRKKSNKDEEINDATPQPKVRVRRIPSSSPRQKKN